MRAAVLALVLALTLAACTALPRGAGLSRDIIASSARTETSAETGAETGADFATLPVTAATLSRIAAWPRSGPAPLPWPATTRAAPIAPPIAPGDTLSLTLWSAGEDGLLSTPGQRMTSLPELRVSPAGAVFLPWAGEVTLAGLTPEEARARIETRLLTVLPAVQVQLARAEGRDNAASLVSGMTRPGSYPLGEGATLLQLLAEGGGVAPGLENPQLRLHRGGRLYGIALETLATDPARDVGLQGGDRLLVVPETRVFLSLGAAGRQARHVFTQEHLSALDALAMIGGLAPTRADASAILILRHYPEAALRASGSGPQAARMIFTIDLTSADGLFSAGQFAIAPGDLVHVSESPLLGPRDLLALAGSVFGLRGRIAGE